MRPYRIFLLDLPPSVQLGLRAPLLSPFEAGSLPLPSRSVETFSSPESTRSVVFHCPRPPPLNASYPDPRTSHVVFFQPEALAPFPGDCRWSLSRGAGLSEPSCSQTAAVVTSRCFLRSVSLFFLPGPPLLDRPFPPASILRRVRILWRPLLPSLVRSSFLLLLGSFSPKSFFSGLFGLQAFSFFAIVPPCVVSALLFLIRRHRLFPPYLPFVTGALGNLFLRAMRSTLALFSSKTEYMGFFPRPLFQSGFHPPPSVFNRLVFYRHTAPFLTPEYAGLRDFSFLQLLFRSSPPPPGESFLPASN